VEPLTEASAERPAAPEPTQRVTALYQTHAVELVRLAVLMVGDQPTAEDVVQDAFLGLYRRWPMLDDQDKALGYVRASVLNGCRMVYRGRSRRNRVVFAAPPAPTAVESAESTALLSEASHEVLLALRRLPDRQREAVVLRYYLDLSEAQAAETMQVSKGTVKSATSRGLATLARFLKETS
jgi:RNA polymerase sigma-70 factor (sigma-E family)